MPKIELPSGKWVEYRDSLMAEDEWATQESFDVQIGTDGTRTMPGAISTIMRRALLARIITNWGGPGLEGIPVPANNIAGAAVMGSHLDSKDYNVLATAVQPLLDEMAPTPPHPQGTAATPTSSSSPSS